MSDSSNIQNTSHKEVELVKNNTKINEETKDVVFKKPELIIGPRRSAAKFGLRKIGPSLEPKSEAILPDSTTDDKVENKEVKEEDTEEVIKQNVQNGKLFPYEEPPWKGVPTRKYSLEVSIDTSI